MPEQKKQRNLTYAVRQGVDHGFIRWAKSFGRELARGKGPTLGTVAIREVFGTLTKLRLQLASGHPIEDLSLQLALLEPKLAYAGQKYRGQTRALRDELVSAIAEVLDQKSNADLTSRFVRLCQGFEVILAFHRAAGGK